MPSAFGPHIVERAWFRASRWNAHCTNDVDALNHGVARRRLPPRSGRVPRGHRSWRARLHRRGLGCYGPAKCIDTDQVKLAAEALARLPFDDLVCDVDPAHLAAARIYPQH
ncbi:DUF1877 family protein [Streptomyces sp. NPDC056390]|uniref:DUF1877 family protein n=1 Tax=Streptomyces sp. NPDC056390 TaxID=3345806 RepID=UPI0035E348F4